MHNAKYKIGDKLVYTYNSSYYYGCKKVDGQTGKVVLVDTSYRTAKSHYLLDFPNGEQWWCEESSLHRALTIGCKVRVNSTDAPHYTGLVGIIEEIIEGLGYPYRIRPLDCTNVDADEALIGFTEEELEPIQRDIKVTLIRKESNNDTV